MTRPSRRLLLAVLLLGLTMTAQAQAPALDVTVTDPAGHAVLVSLADLQALPSTASTLKGERGADLPVSGPTLWAVLDRAGAVDANFHNRVRQTVTATGRDGYSAVVAMGEIDPEFEGKPVLLAIDPDRHMLRLAIPGDKRLGRNVREVVSLAVR